MDCSTSGSSVLPYLLEFPQIHVHWVGDTISPSHPMPSPLSVAFRLSQHQGLYQWVGFSHQVAKVLKHQRQHQSFQSVFRVDFLEDWLFDLAVQGTQNFPCNSVSKESACNAEYLGLIPGFGRSPEEGSDNPHQYSSLENLLDEESGRLQSMG